MAELARDLSQPPCPVSPALPAVLDALPVAVVTFNGAGEIATANSLARLWGAVREGRVSSPRLRRAVRLALATGESTEEEGHLPALPGQERRRPVRARTTVVPGGVILALEDRSALADLDAVRRDFIAGLAHELKTPVGCLLLLSEAALAATEDAGAREQLTRRLHAEAARLASMVRDVLELARVQVREDAPATHPLELGAIVDEAIVRVRPLAMDRAVTISSALGPACMVFGHGPQLVDAVRRLLDNALAVTAAGGTVDVELRRHDGVVDIRVSDRGPGIPGPARERVFERFYRVEPDRSRRTGGTGIGLAVVKHIIERHGGSAFVRSRPGGGSTVVLRLPIAVHRPV